jgi:hypothetical protein
MSEKIAEFINTSNLGYASLLSGVPIVTNTATESAVVKDVAIANPRGVPLVLTVGPSEVARISGSGQFTGAELVAPNTTMHLKLSGGAQMNELFQGTGDRGVNKIRLSTVMEKDGAIAPYVLNRIGVATPPLAGQPSFICFDGNGNFFYSYSSTLYRRAGGINGPETSYSFAAVGICFDGSRYIYAFGGGSVYTFDTLTLSASSRSCGFSTSPTIYASAMDGRIYTRVGAGNPSRIVNPATGSSVDAPYTNGSGTYYFVGLGKDDEGNYVIWQADAAPAPIKWWNIGKNLDGPLVQSQGEVNGSLNTLYSGSTNYPAVRQQGSQSVFYMTPWNQAQLWRFDVRSKELVQLLLPTSTLVTENTSIFVPAANSAYVNEDIGYIGIRATGIKSIERTL